MISGVQVIPLKRTDPHFERFGEIYFTTVYPGAIKGWHKHREMTLNYACIFGRVKVVLYDDREDSSTWGSFMEIFLGPDNYSMVIIPPLVWSGMKGMSEPYAIVANCCTHPHDPSRTTRVDPLDNNIPYIWKLDNISVTVA